MHNSTAKAELGDNHLPYPKFVYGFISLDLMSFGSELPDLKAH